MRIFLACLCAAVAACASGCSMVPNCTSPSCGYGGPGCNQGEHLWNNYCGGGDPCLGTPDCRSGGFNVFDLLFGGACDSGACNGCGSGYVEAPMGCADGSCGLAPVVSAGSAMHGCAGNACDGRCGGRCNIAMSHAGAAAVMARNAVGKTVQHVAQTPQRMQDRCANGTCGLAPGPTQGAVQYPYYTTRAPRDFLLANPPSIGP